MNSWFLLAKELYDKGLSLHQIAREINKPYGMVRYHLIKNNIHNPKLDIGKVDDIVCKKCNQKQPVDNFPYLLTNSSYICRSCHRNRLLKHDLKKLGCTIEQYEQLYTKQNGCCAICGTTIGHKSKNGHSARLAVDHCHTTGKIRGLLCGNCNRGIGCLGEENLQNAINYLKHAE